MKDYDTETVLPPRKHEPPHLSKLTEAFLIAGVALILLLPCFWQPNIQAGDLASHVYNAWLAGQIERGTIQGLALVHPFTNVLADLMLQPLVDRFGRAVAERVVVGLAVEIFFWGAFCFIASANERRSWLIAPSLGMLAYGLIFHFGFLNYYLSVGLSLWILALLWHPSKRRFIFAAPIAVLVFLANVFPLVWAIGVLGYVYIARRIPESQRSLLLAGGVAGLFLVQSVIMAIFPTEWSLDQILSMNGALDALGADQFWLFGTKYLIPLIGIVLIWFVLFLERVDQEGIMSDPLVHVWILNIAAIAVLPSRIMFPMYKLGFSMIPQRVSLFAAILLCAVVAGGRHGRSLTRASVMVAAVFFTCLYLDVQEYSRVEAQIAALVSKLPPGQRIVGSMADSRTRLNGLSHVLDGACLGRCFNYGNYEPSSLQFRVRALGPNKVVASTSDLATEIEYGSHVVTPQEAPLYSICPSRTPGLNLELRKLEAGEKTCGSIEMAVTSQLF